MEHDFPSLSSEVQIIAVMEFNCDQQWHLYQALHILSGRT